MTVVVVTAALVGSAVWSRPPSSEQPLTSSTAAKLTANGCVDERAIAGA